MVENRHLIDALVVRAEAEGIDLRATPVASFDPRADGVDVTLADGTIIEAAAGGRRWCLARKLRERAGIATHGWDYDQSGTSSPSQERDHRAAPKSIFARRPVRDPAADRKTLIAGVDRELQASDAHHRFERRNFTLSSNSALGCISVRSRLDKPRKPARLLRRAFFHWRTAGAGRRRRACDSPDRGAGLNMGLKDAAWPKWWSMRARHGSGTADARSLSALAAVRHHGNGACHQLLNFCSPTNRAAAHRARYRIGTGRSKAAEKPVHPPGRGIVRRSAAAVEGRGAVARRVVNRSSAPLPAA